MALEDLLGPWAFYCCKIKANFTPFLVEAHGSESSIDCRAEIKGPTLISFQVFRSTVGAVITLECFEFHIHIGELWHAGYSVGNTNGEFLEVLRFRPLSKQVRKPVTRFYIKAPVIAEILKT